MIHISFEWYEDKNRSNIRKHKISFEEARSVFYDDNAIEFYDIEHSDDEERFLMLGLSFRLNLLLVCYCTRTRQGIIRIISARKATRNESLYYTGGKA